MLDTQNIAILSTEKNKVNQMIKINRLYLASKIYFVCKYQRWKEKIIKARTLT